MIICERFDFATVGKIYKITLCYIGVDFEFSTMYGKLTAKEKLQFFLFLCYFLPPGMADEGDPVEEGREAFRRDERMIGR